MVAASQYIHLQIIALFFKPELVTGNIRTKIQFTVFT